MAMPEAVFRIAFYAFPLIGVYVALRMAHGRRRLAGLRSLLSWCRAYASCCAGLFWPRPGGHRPS